MIITQTPLRISLAGGGTDIADYYRINNGAVVSSAIDKYIYVIIKKRFDKLIRIGYTKTETVEQVDQVEHQLVRECLRMTGIAEGVEVSTMADIPSQGSGLGSSSTVTVGLLLAMYTYQGVLVTAEALAEQACQIEIEILGKPIGKQDQYIAALGGLRRFDFMADDTVQHSPIAISEDRRDRLSESLMLFYTGKTRSADNILTEQKQGIGNRIAELDTMRDQVQSFQDLLPAGETNELGQLMRTGWNLKKSLSGKISSPDIDSMMNRALDAGAAGGKIAGAGGGGFLMLFCEPQYHAAVRQALSELQELPFRLEGDGAKVIFNARRA